MRSGPSAKHQSQRSSAGVQAIRPGARVHPWRGRRWQGRGYTLRFVLVLLVLVLFCWCEAGAAAASADSTAGVRQWVMVANM